MPRLGARGSGRVCRGDGGKEAEGQRGRGRAREPSKPGSALTPNQHCASFPGLEMTVRARAPRVGTWMPRTVPGRGCPLSSCLLSWAEQGPSRHTHPAGDSRLRSPSTSRTPAHGIPTMCQHPILWMVKWRPRAACRPAPGPQVLKGPTPNLSTPLHCT